MKLLSLSTLGRPRLWIRNRVSLRREGRSAVLVGLLFVIVGHLALVEAVESKRPQWRDPEFFHRQKNLLVLRRWVRERAPNMPTIVILGGSRPQMGLSPEVMHRTLGEGPADPVAFNCAQSGSLPVGERLNFLRLLDAGIQPDFLLIEVLPPVLGDSGPMENRIPLERLSARDAEHLRPYFTDPDGTERRRLARRLHSWHWLRLPIRSALGIESVLPTDPASPHHLWTGMSFHGWNSFSPREWPASIREPRLAVQVESYSKLMPNFEISRVNNRILHDMLADCQRLGIRAALFTMPESPKFRAMYPLQVQKLIRTYLDQLAADHGVPFFDGSEWVESEAAYMDGHHLLAPAASEFTERFSRERVAPWIAGSK